MGRDLTYELVDVGGGARLERFGDRLVDRPHPSAFGERADPGRWREADLRFDRDRGWTGPAAGAGPWSIELDGVSMELRPTEAGQVGLFPEHLAMIPWLRGQVAARLTTEATTGEAPAVLNLFAYTALTTLAVASAGASVTHVDSSRPTVAWARQNTERSGLADWPIRWIVDDALGFTERERRRGRRYAGIVLDPPSYGHGTAGLAWRLEDDLDRLLAATATVLEPGGFVLLTAHTPGFDGDRLAASIARAFRGGAAAARSIERGVLAVKTTDGRALELGAFARWSGGA